MEREEVLFRTLEKHLLSNTMRGLLHSDEFNLDAVLEAAQSAFQRRKSRAGSALENHLEYLFKTHAISYSRTPITENKIKPDFIFPNIQCYHDPSFPADKLTMLAAKRTSKDRWRQIINEAARIDVKHLMTLQPSISENQTAEMQSEKIQLVIPFALHDTYTTTQRPWLMSVQDFLNLAKERQAV